MVVLSCKNISRKIGKRSIVHDIDFDIGQGEIFGFLGPNGAGKTTTIRMITGLIEPTKGEIHVMGYSLKSERYKALQCIGAIVENPEMYPYLSGWQNLKQIARIDPRITEGRIKEVVERVKLTGRIHDKVKTYSLGMKQRLGLAQAILHRPQLLVLDEPTNGLDPNGIIEFREMIRELARVEGIAVFISSHILSEIEQLCDRVAIINHGSIQSMEVMNLKDESNSWISIKVQNIGEMTSILDSITYIKEYHIKGCEIMASIQQRNVPQLIKSLVAANAGIEQVIPKTVGLEEKFMKIVGGN